jgi:hypothetical protein
LPERSKIIVSWPALPRLGVQDSTAAGMWRASIERECTPRRLARSIARAAVPSRLTSATNHPSPAVPRPFGTAVAISTAVNRPSKMRAMKAQQAKHIVLGHLREPCQPETVLQSIEVARVLRNGGRTKRVPVGFELFAAAE